MKTKKHCRLFGRGAYEKGNNPSRQSHAGHSFGFKKPFTMTFHLWRNFVVFAVVILLALWLLQVVFLNAFYEDMKRSETEKIGNELVECYYSDPENFNHNSRSYGVFAILLNSDGEIVQSPHFVPEFQKKPVPDGERAPKPDPPHQSMPISNLDYDSWQSFVKRLEGENDKVTTYTIEERHGSKTMVYGAVLTDADSGPVYLYLSTPLEPIDTTRQVLQRQLIIVSILSLLASLVVAYFLAKRFSMPIVRISESAKKLGSGKYDVCFEAGHYREISDLAGVLNSASRQLGKTDELRRDLMANVSHDLKTPLTIIKSYAEMIHDISGDNKEKRDAHTRVIIDEANRLALLVNDILDLSKLESGISQPEMSRFSLSDVVKSTVERLENYVTGEDYTIDLSLCENAMAMGDEAKIGQVIYNLVANAINYCGEDKYIKVSLFKAPGRLRFEVEDRGEGIGEDELPFVWDRYYRSGKNHIRQASGTGIGLSITKNILEAHGAKYGVESTVGKGSVFWFELEAAE